LFGAQVIEGETNYWNPSAPYISAEVENAPPGTDILQLLGGLDQTYKVTLSEPIKDPVMAIVSLGSPSITITYDFDSPFTIVSQGAGYWGGGPTSLVQLPGDVLQGTEGHGTIRFIGTFSTFSWTVPMPEGWHGFTFAIRTTERIEPTEAGAPDALTDDAKSDGATDSGRTTAKGGCNCAVSGPDRGAGALAAVALLALSWLRARRRRQI
jgi:MYXO-CTERM domain-containing protein